MAAGPFRKAVDLPQVISVFPLDGALVLPHAQLPLRIFEPRYLNMIDDAMASERMIGMVQTRAGGDAERPRLARVGCLGRITSFAETTDDCYLITLTGVCRFAVGEELPLRLPYRQVQARYADYESDLKPYLERRQLDVDWESAKTAPSEALVNSLSMLLPFDVAEKQALLEAPTLIERREALIALMEIDTLGRTGDDDAQTPLQ